MAFINSAFLPKLTLLPHLLISCFLFPALEQGLVDEQTLGGFALQIRHLLSCPINTYDMNEWGNDFTSLSLDFLIWKDT